MDSTKVFNADEVIKYKYEKNNYTLNSFISNVKLKLIFYFSLKKMLSKARLIQLLEIIVF